MDLWENNSEWHALSTPRRSSTNAGTHVHFSAVISQTLLCGVEAHGKWPADTVFLSHLLRRVAPLFEIDTAGGRVRRSVQPFFFPHFLGALNVRGGCFRRFLSSESITDDLMALRGGLSAALIRSAWVLWVGISASSPTPPPHPTPHTHTHTATT